MFNNQYKNLYYKKHTDEGRYNFYRSWYVDVRDSLNELRKDNEIQPRFIEVLKSNR